MIDPVRGRVLIGVALVGAVGDPQPRAEALRDHLLVTYTYGAPGPVGAHPISRAAATGKFARGGQDSPRLPPRPAAPAPE